MAVSVEKSGKTVQEAIDLALEELNATLEEVVIEVLDEGEQGGLLGIGRRPARVSVSIEEEDASEEDGALPEYDDEDEDDSDNDDSESDGEEEDAGEEEETDGEYFGDDEDYDGEPESPDELEAVNFVSSVLSGIGIRGQITSYKEDGTIYIDVTGEDVGAVIGRRGETLNALQYLVTLVACRKAGEHVRVSLDIGGYRRRREASLAGLAERTADKVLDSGTPYSLEPMNPAERRIVHTSLQDFRGVTTYSEGEGDERHVVIAPASDDD